MEILAPEISQYLNEVTPESPAILKEMEEYAREHKFPIIGPLAGRFLQQIVHISGASRIFEMGSGFGYSALWMSLVLQQDGRINCTEFDAANIERGQSYHERANVTGKVTWHQGDALEFMRKAEGPFDMIVNDVDKHQYPESLQVAWSKLRRGGIMITDNSLWGGRVVTEEEPARSTAGVKEVNRVAYELSDAMTTIIPIRDGLLMSVKM